MSQTPPYMPAFFQAISDGSTRSARVVVPLLMSLIRPRSVVDVGCGWGKWLTVFRESGVTDVLGIDGPYVDPARTDLAATEFIPHDLTKPLAVGRVFDLAVSLEVAEHLPPEAADGFVVLLASLAPVVAFSAAIPGQGGTNHLNERWPDYWARKFAAKGFLVVDAVRPAIWSHPDVEWWYAQNLLVFAAVLYNYSIPRKLARDFGLRRAEPAEVITGVSRRMMPNFDPRDRRRMPSPQPRVDRSQRTPGFHDGEFDERHPHAARR